MINTNAEETIEYLDFDTAYDKVLEEVDRILSTAPSIIRIYTSHLAKARGKFLRAYALLVCAMDEQGKVHPDAVIFASSIEVLHLATLVHDDIMDNADVRRGIPTLQKKFGKRTAVICGDYLLSAALKSMLSIRDKNDYANYQLPDYVERICMGELRQHINNGNIDLSLYRYLSIINGKTAALFEASFYGGSILSETDDSRLRLYRRLGRHVGMIFQLTDDCIDFETEEHIAKKNVQSDYEQGVVTLPLIYTFEKDPGLKQKARTEALTRSEINAAVARAGGLDFTRIISRRYFDKACSIIDILNLSAPKQEKLMMILEKAYFGLKKS